MATSACWVSTVRAPSGGLLGLRCEQLDDREHRHAAGPANRRMSRIVVRESGIGPVLMELRTGDLAVCSEVGRAVKLSPRHAPRESETDARPTPRWP